MAPLSKLSQKTEKTNYPKLLQNPPEASAQPHEQPGTPSEAKQAGSSTDRAGELAGGRQLQAAGLGSVLPLQPESEEGADARQFRVSLHPPIPVSMAQCRSPPPPGAGWS